MHLFNIHAAKTQFSRLVDEAEAGAEIIIARAGKPVARLVPLATGRASSKRSLGSLAGRLSVPAGFDAPLSNDEIADFEGR